MQAGNGWFPKGLLGCREWHPGEQEASFLSHQTRQSPVAEILLEANGSRASVVPSKENECSMYVDRDATEKAEFAFSQRAFFLIPEQLVRDSSPSRFQAIQLQRDCNRVTMSG